ncbi:hypothetical protein ACA910_003112 [Epithemia clementina (nom. ined.)]
MTVSSSVASPATGEQPPGSNGRDAAMQEGLTIESPNNNAVLQQEEDVLRDVLDELDRERTRRAELEVNLRKLTEEHEVLRTSYKAVLAQQQEQAETIRKLRQESTSVAAKTDDNQEITRRAFMAMETQVKEYQALVDALTQGKPAIVAAAAASTVGETNGSSNKQQHKSKMASAKQQAKAPSLPLYAVRLLEILPWTPHAQEHVFFKEEIYEWQFYDHREKQWISNLRGFPHFFKSLPVVRPKTGKEIIGDNSKDKDRGLLLFLAGGGGKNNPTAPSKNGVLTDEPMTHILSIEEGYPLPADGGTWEWIGGWSIEKRVSSRSGSPTSLKQRVDCDQLGWSYAQEAQYFAVNPTEWVWDNPGEEDLSNKTGFQRNLRRRKWTRRRVLVDYPFASEQTKEYLKLLAENARLTVTSNKISDQLVETKTALTDNEEVLMREKSEAAAELRRLREELQLKEEMLREAGIDFSHRSRAGNAGNPLQEFLAKNEQMKGLGSKISQWVKSSRAGEASSPSAAAGSMSNENVANTSAGMDDQTDESSERDNNMGSRQQSGFDWKKVGRPSFFDKLKGHNSNPDRNNVGLKPERLIDKLNEQSNKTTQNLSEGSSTDESVEDVVVEMQEAV